MNLKSRLTRVLSLSLAAAIAAGLAGCASTPEPNTPGAAARSVEYGAGAGLSRCVWDPKDPSRYEGSTDDSAVCPRIVGQVLVKMPPPSFAQRDANASVDARSGPFVEVGYAKLGDVDFDGTYLYEDVPVDDRGSIEAEAFFTGAGYYLPVTPKLSLSGKAGFALWDVDEDEVFGGVPESHSASGTDPYYGLGVSWALKPSLFVEAQWERFTDIGEPGETGRDDVDSLGVTLNWRFGANEM